MKKEDSDYVEVGEYSAPSSYINDVIRQDGLAFYDETLGRSVVLSNELENSLRERDDGDGDYDYENDDDNEHEDEDDNEDDNEDEDDDEY